MHTDPRPQRSSKVLGLNSGDDFLDREIVAIGVFAMKKSCGDPGFGGNGYVYRGYALQFVHLHI
jgi:hypothetical protein